MDGELAEAVAGQAVTLRLDREIDASRGDVLSLSQAPLEMTDQFEATLVWMNDEPDPGRAQLRHQDGNSVGLGINYRDQVSGGYKYAGS